MRCAASSSTISRRLPASTVRACQRRRLAVGFALPLRLTGGKRMMNSVNSPGTEAQRISPPKARITRWQ